MNQEEIIQQLQAAVKAYQGRDLDSAEAIFKTILAVNPKEPSALHLLGCIYKDRGQLQQAVDLIQAAIREDDSNPIPFLNLGKILAIAGQHENAAGVFQESLKRGQQIPETWFCFGNALREIAKAEDAKQAYSNALQLNLDHAGAASNLGALLTDEGELDEAEELLSKAIEQAPRDVSLRINYGILLAAKDENIAAIEQYRFALPIAPESPELHYNFANLLKAKGEVEEAIASYRKAIELKPDFADVYFSLAFFLIRQARILEALNILREGDQNCKNSPKVKHLLGTLLISQGRKEEGTLFLQEAFSIDSSYGQKVDGFSLRSDTPEALWISLHSTERSHLGYWAQNPRRSKLASVICSLDGVNSVLECGCNVGGNLAAINSLNNQIKLKGVDMNSKTIEFGKKKFAELGVDVDMSVMRLQDLGSIESKSADVAYTSAVLQHIPPEFIPDILANMIRISRKYVVFWELHGFSPADAYVHHHAIDASPSLDGRWLHDYWNILTQLGVDRQLITAQQLDPKICLGKVSDANCIFSFPIP